MRISAPGSPLPRAGAARGGGLGGPEADGGVDSTRSSGLWWASPALRLACATARAAAGSSYCSRTGAMRPRASSPTASPSLCRLPPTSPLNADTPATRPRTSTAATTTYSAVVTPRQCRRARGEWRRGVAAGFMTASGVSRPERVGRGDSGSKKRAGGYAAGPMGVSSARSALTRPASRTPRFRPRGRPDTRRDRHPAGPRGGPGGPRIPARQPSAERCRCRSRRRR